MTSLKANLKNQKVEFLMKQILNDEIERKKRSLELHREPFLSSVSYMHIWAVYRLGPNGL